MSDDKDERITSLPTGDDGKPDFRKNHGCCRDFPCLIIFLACIIAAIVIFAIGFSQGEPGKLIYPINKQGQYCGKKDDSTDDPYDWSNAKYLYFDFGDPDTLKILETKDLSTLEQFCVEHCPDENEKSINKTTGAVYKESCASDDDTCYNITYSYENADLVYRCYPKKFTAVTDLEMFSPFKNVFTTAVSDLSESWWVILLAAVFALILSFLFMLCFRCIGKCVVWLLLIVSLIAMFAAGAWGLIYGITSLKDADLDVDKKNYYIILAFGGVMLLFGIIFFFILCGLRKKISLAVDLIIVASRVLTNSCLLILVPIVYMLLFVIATAGLVVMMIFYFSSLEIVTHNGENGNAGTRTIEFTTNTRYVIIFAVFMFFWVLFFFVGMNQSTIAGTAAEWYFVKDRANDLPTFPIARSLKVLILHHIGSVAFGSLIIALIATVRAIVLYIQKKMKESGQADKQPIKCLFACVNCCLACLQRIVEYITSKAYIMMMIRGKCFISSAVDAVKLLLRNIVRTSLLTVISTVIIVLAIAGVAALSTLICALILHPALIGLDTTIVHVHYWWLSVLLCFIVAFAVAFLVLQIYDFLINAIFLCFLVDEEVAQYNATTGYAPPELKQYFDNVNLEANAEREKKKTQVMVTVAQ